MQQAVPVDGLERHGGGEVTLRNLLHDLHRARRLAAQLAQDGRRMKAAMVAIAPMSRPPSNSSTSALR
jgi:hypothetical protein